MSDAAVRNLTDVWQGLYSYPGLAEPVAFVATLFETESWLGGTTHETTARPGESPATHCAMLDGARAGQRIDFTKTYDGAAGWSHAVRYDGVLSADATEIEGNWRLAGHAPGKFLMVRSSSKAKSETRKAFEKA